MDNDDRKQLFDTWAATYDRSLSEAESFPFDGYDRILDEITRRADARPDLLVLDVGTGTGNLAQRLVAYGCRVWGIDFSADMLVQAQAKVPQATFVQADLNGDWPAELQRRFDRIVSAYVLHEFDLTAKLRLIQRLAQHLTMDGRIVSGDIAFATMEDRAQAHRRWAQQWDDDEYYWAGDEASIALQQLGYSVQYTQISSCGGILEITPFLANRELLA